MRNRLMLLALFALLAKPAQAQKWTAEAHSLEFKLTYIAPKECPSAGDFLNRLNDHVLAGGDNGLSGVIVIAPSEDQYVLRMNFHTGTIQERWSTDCDELVSAAVLEAGMARSSVSRETIVAVIVHLGAQKIVPESRALSALGEEPLSASEIQEPLTPQVTAVDENSGGARPALPIVALDEFPRVSFAPQAQVASGVLPELAVGLGASASIWTGNVQLRAEGTWWKPQDWAPLQANRLGSSRLSLWSASVWGCSDFAEAQMNKALVGLKTCLGAGASRLTLAKSSSFESARVYNGSFGMKAGLSLRYQRFFLEVLGGMEGVVRGEALRFVSSPSSQEVGELAVAERQSPTFRTGQSVASVGLNLGWDIGGD